MSKNNSTRIKIPHTKWSIDIANAILLPLSIFMPVIASLLLASIFGFEALYVIGLVILSYMLVTGIDFVNDEKDTKRKEDR